jgi:toxin ParE1/3/4
MPVIHRTSRALLDVAEIALTIAEDNPHAADRWLELIDGKFGFIAQTPELGRKRFELAPNLRSLPVGNYVIFYLPLPDGIQIVRVLHGARDIPALFD